MRKPIQERVRKVRKQLEQQQQTATGPEAEQVAVLADYADGDSNGDQSGGQATFRVCWHRCLGQPDGSP